MNSFNWSSRWIGRPGVKYSGADAPVLPAPCLRGHFTLASLPQKAILRICGLGYYECLINDKKIADSVLAPRPSIYDKHVWFDTLDVTSLLQPGDNLIAVLLGNGLYNCSTPDTWHFRYAPWRDYPKLLAEIQDENGNVLLGTGPDWKFQSSPIVFDALRNGETYDARLDFPWSSTVLDDKDWPNAGIVPSPGGVLLADNAPPCRVLETIPMDKISVYDCYDAHENLAGRIRITVEGPCGAAVKIQYAERVTSDYKADVANQSYFIHGGEFQTDNYILSGRGIEQWEARFTYHGFRYAQITADADVKILAVEARKIGSDLKTIGELHSGNPVFDRLQLLTRRTFLASFVGFPCDCPHREKNGWTGDAMIACDTGLYNFDTAESYHQWLSMLRDCQRPSGQLPAIVPSPGWGYSDAGGPVWDSALFEIPYRLYKFTGDLRHVSCNYDAIVRYLSYCASLLDNDNQIDIGIGDWCHWEDSRRPTVRFSATASYIGGLAIAAQFADLLGKSADAQDFRYLHSIIKSSFNQLYNHGGGHYAEDRTTELATALFFHIAEPSDAPAIAERLAIQLRERNHRADFGILGAKYTPRVLADYGYADDAFKLFIQQEYPGWGYAIASGATTLWEHWDGTQSQNHIMFGDPSAWFFRYAGGFRYDFSHPGPNFIRIEPKQLSLLGDYKVSHRGYVLEHTNGTFHVTIPPKCQALVTLPGCQPEHLGPGKY